MYTTPNLLRPQHALHGSLKGGGSVGESKAKHFELLVAKGCVKRCLFHIFWSDADLMVP